MAEHLTFWAYDPDMSVICPKCGWTGRAGDHQDLHREVLDVRCAVCDTMLLIVAYPTLAETRDAAAAGDERARADLSKMQEHKAWHERAERLQLRSPDQLPDLADEPLLILWDLEIADDEEWQVLRHGDAEIWRELAYFESYARFQEVFEILRQRYGSRLAEVRPTPGSKMWLYGDRLSAPDVIDRLNASLRADSAMSDE
jgi:hypothetical protein